MDNLMYQQDQIWTWFDSIQLANGQKLKKQSYLDGDFHSGQGLSEIKYFSLVGQMFKQSSVGDGMRMRLWRKSALLRSEPSAWTLAGERHVFPTYENTYFSVFESQFTTSWYNTYPETFIIGPSEYNPST